MKRKPPEPKLTVLRCVSCLHPLGLSTSRQDFRVFCNAYCAADFRLRLNEERDSFVEYLADVYEMTPTQIARQMGKGMSHQTVYGILQRRFSPG